MKFRRINNNNGLSTLRLAILCVCTLLQTSTMIPIVTSTPPPGAKTNEKRPIEERKTIAYIKRHADSLTEAHIDFESHHHLNELSTDDASEAATFATSLLTSSLTNRLSDLFEKTTTAECRAKIATHFSYFVNAIGEETDLPFSNIQFQNTCPEEPLDFDDLPHNITFTDIMNREYRPKDGKYKDMDELSLLYGILTHEYPESTIRLIETLYEKTAKYEHHFVIHVDGKERSDETFGILEEYARGRDHVHLVPRVHRVRVNWGGFSMVNATLQMIKYSFGLLEGFPNHIEFDKFVHLASTSYPIKSNYEIRHTIASYPLDANLFHVVMKPLSPNRKSWHYFIECDDALHRIYQLPPLKAGSHGISMYTSSQWFVGSRDFVEYLARREEGTLVDHFLGYAEHVAVSDETFFGTILRQTKFCMTHHNSNLLHYQFDRWESEIDGKERDARKCIQPDPNKCGRSPTTMTTDYLAVLDVSDALFARKFDDDVNPEVKVLLDMKREREEKYYQSRVEGKDLAKTPLVDMTFEGQGVLIVTKETVDSETPLCLGLGSKDNKVKFVPCFYRNVVPSLSPRWESGAVIEEEILPNNRWEIGPCSSDGNLQRSTETGEIIVTSGSFTTEGPHCMIKQRGGRRNGRCLDIEGEKAGPGEALYVYPCISKWHQLFSFGTGGEAPISTIHASVPSHILETISRKGKDLVPYLCAGAAGRGVSTHKPWEEDENRKLLDSTDFLPEISLLQNNNANVEKKQTFSLDLWKGKYFVTVPCSDLDAVTSFVFVPFIIEEDGGSKAKHDVINSSDGSNKIDYNNGINKMDNLNEERAEL